MWIAESPLNPQSAVRNLQLSMPAITLAICGNQISISARSPRLVRLFADYFSYYSPSLVTENDQSPIPTEREVMLQIELKMRDKLPPRQQLIPSSAELVSQTGVVGLWRESAIERQGDGETGQSAIRNPQSAIERMGERFFFDLEVAAFRVDVEAGKVIGLITPQAMEYPHILANTYALFALLLMLRSRRLYHLHAAAIVSPTDELWLVCGAQRAGKTALATALGLAGWRPVSDDSLLVGTDEQSAFLTPLKKHFHIGDELFGRWPTLDGMTKHHQYLGRTCAGGLEFFKTRELAETRFRKVDHIVLPQIINEPVSRLESLSRSGALLRLAEQSMFFQLWREHTSNQWQWLNELAAKSQCHRLFSASDVMLDPNCAAKALGGFTVSSEQRSRGY
ncbi:MAG: hypothetical protein ACRD82_08795 [Blastocatellia bacterium]